MMQNNQRLGNDFEVYSHQGQKNLPQQQCLSQQAMQIQQPNIWNQFQYHNQQDQSRQPQTVQTSPPSPQPQLTHLRQSQKSQQLQLSKNQLGKPAGAVSKQSQVSNKIFKPQNAGRKMTHNSNGYPFNKQQISSDNRKDKQQAHFKGQNFMMNNLSKHQTKYSAEAEMTNQNQRFNKTLASNINKNTIHFSKKQPSHYSKNYISSVQGSIKKIDSDQIKENTSDYQDYSQNRNVYSQQNNNIEEIFPNNINNNKLGINTLSLRNENIMNIPSNCKLFPHSISSQTMINQHYQNSTQHTKANCFQNNLPSYNTTLQTQFTQNMANQQTQNQQDYLQQQQQQMAINNQELQICQQGNGLNSLIERSEEEKVNQSKQQNLPYETNENNQQNDDRINQQYQQQQLSSNKCYRRNSIKPMNYNQTSINSAYLNQGQTHDKVIYKQKNNGIKKQKQRKLNQNKYKHQLKQVDNSQQCQPTVGSNHYAKLPTYKEKTKRISKQLKNSNDNYFSKFFILQQYKKYKKLKQKMNRIFATPKITTQALMNNQMNDFQEMNREKQIVMNESQKVEEENKGNDLFQAHNDSNLHNENNIDIFPIPNTNQTSMIDTILENEEKKKEFYKNKIYKLLDRNGCNDLDLLKKLVQLLYQKLIKKSEKVRHLKNILKDKNQKLKQFKSEKNGKEQEDEGEEDYLDEEDDEEEDDIDNSFEEQEFDDDEDNDEDLYDIESLSEINDDSDENIDEECEIGQVEYQEQNGDQDEEIQDDGDINQNLIVGENNIQLIQSDDKQTRNHSTRQQEMKKNHKKNHKHLLSPLSHLIKQCSLTVNDRKTEGHSNLDHNNLQNLRTAILVNQNDNSDLNHNLLEQKMENENNSVKNETQVKDNKNEQQHEISGDDIRNKSQSF